MAPPDPLLRTSSDSDGLFRYMTERAYKVARPGAGTRPRGVGELTAVDPFGNRTVVFWDARVWSAGRAARAARP